MIEFSDIQSVYYFLPFFGFVIGIFGTMLGGGGGFFFVPLLTLWIGVPAQTAVITSLVATLPICVVGTLEHYRQNHIDFRAAVVFIITGIIGAFAGTKLSRGLSEVLLKTAFGIYSIAIALNMVLTTWRKAQVEKGNTEEKKFKSNKAIRFFNSSFFGLAAGTITGTFGTSGTAPVLAGLFSIKIPFKLVIGTSLLVVLVNSLFAVGAHFMVGIIDLTLVSFLTAGSAAGAVVGPKLLSSFQPGKYENKTRYWYAALMIGIGILMITGNK
ncbi:MAG: sulfite exporter TauE/SafE family protein [Prolixibacteraceae bacterium]|nr:sulfite exporter TauE/SafE family protein [Prolixibacteraceae bacterium]